MNRSGIIPPLRHTKKTQALSVPAFFERYRRDLLFLGIENFDAVAVQPGFIRLKSV